jgi:hypothetical protein
METERMPKKTYNQITKEWFLRNCEDMQILQCTKAYRRFCQKNNLEEGTMLGAFLETIEGQQILD